MFTIAWHRSLPCILLCVIGAAEPIVLASDGAETTIPPTGMPMTEPVSGSLRGMFMSGNRIVVFDADSDTFAGAVDLPPLNSYDCSITADQALGFVVDFNRNV